MLQVLAESDHEMAVMQDDSFRHHLIALMLLVAVVGLAFLPVVAGDYSVFGLDRFMNPLWEAAAWGFRGGEWPFWTPHIRAGYPLFANGEASIAYPLTRPLLSVWPPQRALDVFVLVHLVAAGFAMWLYLRELSLAPSVAFAGAVAFALSGRMIASTIWAHAIAASVSLPLVLLGIERVGRDRRSGMLWVALGVSLGGLAGRPQRLLPALMFAGAYALYIVLMRGRRSPRAGQVIVREGLAVALGGLLGLGVAAVQLLPTAAFVAESQWGGGIPQEMFDAYSLRHAGWQGVVLPPSPEHRIGTRSYPGLVVYAGLMLAVVGFCRRDPRARDLRSSFLAVATAACLYLAFAGPGTHELFSQIPGLRSLRAPVRFLYPACLGLVVLAAVEGGRWLQGRPRFVVRGIVALGCLELIVVARMTAPLVPSEVYAVRPVVLDKLESELFAPDAVGARPRFLAADALFRTEQAFFEKARPKRVLRRLKEIPPAYNLAMRFDLRSAFGYGEPQFGWQETLMRRPTRQLVDQLGTRILFLADPSDEYELLGRYGASYAHRNPAALSRAVCVSRLSTVATATDAGRRASMDDFSARTMAILEIEPLPQIDQKNEQPCKIRMIHNTANRVEFDVESPGTRLLVVFDAWAPGWSVRVDSSRARLFRANGMFRGVLVPEGRSHVEFSYVPPGLVAGLGLSAASSALLALAFWWRREQQA